MKIFDLRLAVSVARRGSFVAAAKEHDLDPSSASRAIAELEDLLGFRLFQRSTRRLSLTEAGERYIGKIEPLLSELEYARELALADSSAPRGILRFTSSVTFGVMRITPLLPKFRARYPDVKLECIFTEDNLDLVAERIDLAVRLGPAISGDLISARLLDVRYKVVASPAYVRRMPKLNHPKDLGQHRVLLFNIRDFRSSWLFRDKAGKITEVEIDGDVTLTPAESVRLSAINGMGPTLLATWMIDDDLKSGKLVDLFPKHEVTASTFERGVWLVYPSRSYLPAKVRVMIDFLRAEI
jgi:DNA-binding transcriptional LysR family regulator